MQLQGDMEEFWKAFSFERLVGLAELQAGLFTSQHSFDIGLVAQNNKQAQDYA